MTEQELKDWFGYVPRAAWTSTTREQYIRNECYLLASLIYHIYDDMEPGDLSDPLGLEGYKTEALLNIWQAMWNALIPLGVNAHPNFSEDVESR